MSPWRMPRSILFAELSRQGELLLGQLNASRTVAVIVKQSQRWELPASAAVKDTLLHRAVLAEGQKEVQGHCTNGPRHYLTPSGTCVIVQPQSLPRFACLRLQEAPDLSERSVPIRSTHAIVNALGLILDQAVGQGLFALVPYVLAEPDRLAAVFVGEATVFTGKGGTLPTTVEALFQGALAVVAVILVAFVVGVNGALAACAGGAQGAQSADKAAVCDGVGNTHPCHLLHKKGSTRAPGRGAEGTGRTRPRDKRHCEVGCSLGMYTPKPASPPSGSAKMTGNGWSREPRHWGRSPRRFGPSQSEIVTMYGWHSLLCALCSIWEIHYTDLSGNVPTVMPVASLCTRFSVGKSGNVPIRRLEG